MTNQSIVKLAPFRKVPTSPSDDIRRLRPEYPAAAIQETG
jgi:hypothetical protein